MALISVVIFTTFNLLFRILAVKSLNLRIFPFIFNSLATVFAFIIFKIELNLIELPKAISIAQIILILLAIIFSAAFTNGFTL